MKRSWPIESAPTASPDAGEPSLPRRGWPDARVLQPIDGLSPFASASSDAFDSMTTDARAWTSGCAAGAYAAN